MNFVSKLKEHALTIAVIVILLAIVFTIYNQFFSDKARIIRMLKDQIKQQEQTIKKLQKEYSNLVKEEQKRLEEFNKLKDKLANLQETINNEEAKIDDIKNEIIELDSALSIIEGHTRGSVSHGLGILHSDSTGTRK